MHCACVSLKQWEPSDAQRRCVREVAEAFGVSHTEVLGRGRNKHLWQARRAVVWVVQARWPDLGYCRMARLLARREHSTIITIMRAARRDRNRDAEFRALTDALLDQALDHAPRVDLSALAAGIADREEKPEPCRQARPRKVLAKNRLHDAETVIDAQDRDDAFLAALLREHPERCGVAA